MFVFDRVTKNYQGKEVLKNISFSVDTGEIIGIIGKSGSGKSTLLRMMNLIEPPDKGSIQIYDKSTTNYSAKEIQQLKKSMGMVFQQYNLLNNLTVAENIALPMKLSGKKVPEKVLELLQFVGLEDRQRFYPAQLSGGEKQRAALARALVREPKILFCDEATSSLDEERTDEVSVISRKCLISL